VVPDKKAAAAALLLLALQSRAHYYFSLSDLEKIDAIIIEKSLLG